MQNKTQKYYSDVLKINESVVDNSTDLNQDIVNFIGLSLKCISQFHIFHWLTDNAHEHEIYEEFYKALQDELDSIVEQSLVLFDLNLDFQGDNSIAFDYIDLTILEDLSNVTNTVLSKLDDVEHKAIKHEFSEVQELINKLNYKLELE